MAATQNGSRCARTLIVDDHPLMRAAVRDLLSQHPDFGVCGEAATLDDARRLCGELEPDLVVLDLRLPDGNGLRLVEESRTWARRPLVLILSADPEAGPEAVEAMRLGAAGFVNKHAGPADLLRIARQVCEGRPYLNDEMLSRLLRRR